MSGEMFSGVFVEWAEQFSAIDDLDEAVKKGFADLDLTERAQVLLHYPLKKALRELRRHTARRGEYGERQVPLRAVFNRGEPGELLPSEEESLIELRRRRLEKTFVLIDENGNPTGKRVSWGEATEQQHALYINYLQRGIKGIEETISEHREAIRLLRVHSVSCLNEIDDAA